MTMNPRLLKKITATTLALALVALAPGLESYRLFAQAVVTHAVPTANSAIGAGAAVGTNVLSVPGAGGIVSAPLNLQNGLLPNIAPTGVAVRTQAAAVQAAVPAASAQTLQTSVFSRSKAVPAAVQGVPAAGSEQRAADLKTLLAEPRAVALPVQEIEAMPASSAKGAGERMMDRILGRRSASFSSDVPVPVDGAPVSRAAALVEAARTNAVAEPAAVPSPAPAQTPEPARRGRVADTVLSVARIALAGAAVYGLQLAAATFLPAMFGFVPVAALWTLSSGVVLVPAALYARYRLSLRDSPRLNGVKLALDLFLGAYLGAAAVALPAFLGGAAVTHFLAATPLVAAASAVGLSAAAKGKGEGFLGKIVTWFTLTLPAAFLGVSGALPLTFSAVASLAALPAMTTVAFFLGFLIRSAETGRPFAVPGSLQPLRFPSYTWVLTGVVFALLTGYSPIMVNGAFFAWMFLGKGKGFDYLYGALAAWAVYTGFAAPITFLVLAFLPERAQVWSERLMSALLPAAAPAPSTAPAQVEPEAVAYPKPTAWPRFHYWLKTGLSLGALVGMGAVMSFTVFGVGTLLGNLAFVSVLMGLQLWFSKDLIKKTMQTAPTDEGQDPEVFSIMRELREIINKELAKKGKAPIPMPEIINVKMGVPNAFATGISPNKALVGVTIEIKEMLLEPEGLREGLLRLVKMTDPSSKSFVIFRTAIRGSIAGISENAGQEELSAALRAADAAQLKALGYRALRGVLGHEFSHVMNRDMILGAVAGGMSSAIAFSSYKILWAVGHAKAALQKFYDRLTGKPERRTLVAPALGAALGLLKIFIALWAPIAASLVQMASSRTREGGADEDGALLSSDPASLALGLGLLTSWRPKPGVTIEKARVPLIASLAHMLTVNPFEQLAAAGQLPELDAMAKLAVGKADDFFFDLFVTHPNTTQRIERLGEMQKALDSRRAENIDLTIVPGAAVRRDVPSLRDASQAVLPLDPSIDPVSDRMKSTLALRAPLVRGVLAGLGFAAAGLYTGLQSGLLTGVLGAFVAAPSLGVAAGLAAVFVYEKILRRGGETTIGVFLWGEVLGVAAGAVLGYYALPLPAAIALAVVQAAGGFVWGVLSAKAEGKPTVGVRG